MADDSQSGRFAQALPRFTSDYLAAPWGDALIQNAGAIRCREWMMDPKRWLTSWRNQLARMRDSYSSRTARVRDDRAVLDRRPLDERERA